MSAVGKARRRKIESWDYDDLVRWLRAEHARFTRGSYRDTWKQPPNHRRATFRARGALRRWLNGLFELPAFKKSLWTYDGRVSAMDLAEWSDRLRNCFLAVHLEVDPVEWKLLNDSGRQARERIFSALEGIAAEVAPPYAERLRNLLGEMKHDPGSVNGAELIVDTEWLRHLGRRGAAKSSRDGALRGIFVRELDAYFPGDTKERYACIAALLRHCGLPTTPVQVRSILLRGRT